MSRCFETFRIKYLKKLLFECLTTYFIIKFRLSQNVWGKKQLQYISEGWWVTSMKKLRSFLPLKL